MRLFTQYIKSIGIGLFQGRQADGDDSYGGAVECCACGERDCRICGDKALGQITHGSSVIEIQEVANPYNRYESARRNSEIARLRYMRDNYIADMRKVEASLRKAVDRREINCLEHRWRWLNSKVCEIDKRELSLELT